jgi:hypothetical protein
LRLNDAIRCWNLIRQKRGSKAYQKSDLDQNFYLTQNRDEFSWLSCAS